MKEVGILIVLSSAILGTIQPRGAFCNEESEAAQESATAAQLRSRGYVARDYSVPVQGGKCTLNLVRATNPLIDYERAGFSRKEPLLFVHGLFTGAKFFLYTDDRVRPRDYSGLDIETLSTEELEKLLEGDSGARSMAFTTLNFGYEIWLLNRRSTSDSLSAHLNRTRQTSGNTAPETSLQTYHDHYWNFSYDEQALHDIPEVIEFVLRESRADKLSLVTYSAGGTLTLMALSERPELATKIKKALLWAPVLDHYMPKATENDYKLLFDSFVYIITKLMIPYPSDFMKVINEKWYDTCCNSELLRPYICFPISDLLLGAGMSQSKIERASSEHGWVEAVGSGEFAHLMQTLNKRLAHKYDYFDERKNFLAYGRRAPPQYSVSQVQLDSMSLWFGNTDNVARLASFNRMTADRLTVPITKYVIGNSSVQFNHNGFQHHKDVDRLLIIPSLKELAAETRRAPN